MIDFTVPDQIQDLREQTATFMRDVVIPAEARDPATGHGLDPALRAELHIAAKNAGERGILWWEMCAIIVVMIIPVIIMAIFLQRFIAKGVLLGAVKG